MKLTVESRGTNYVIYKEGYIRLDDVRISFPHFAYPQERTNDSGKVTQDYNCTLILPKETHEEARKALVGMNNALLKANADNKGKPPAIPSDKRYLRDGDQADEEGNKLHRDEYQGAYTVTAANKKRPVARDGQRNKLEDLDKIEEMFYSGSRINALVRPWFFDGKARGSTETFPKRLSCSLEAVQFWRDDEPFVAGRPDDDDVWDDAPKSAMGDDDDDNDEL